MRGMEGLDGLLARAAVGLEGENVGTGAGLEVEGRGRSHGGRIGCVKLVMGRERREEGEGLG